MICRLALFGILLCAIPLLAQDTPPDKSKEKPADKSKVPLTVGKDLPGAFNPYNLNGSRKDRFHCLVSDHGLNPAVLLFCRGIEMTDGLKDLLVKLDGLVEKKPTVQLAVFVIFVPDDLKDQVVDDVRRKELATKIEDEIIKPLMLKHVLFGLTSKTDVEAYALPDSAQITSIAYNKYKIQSVQMVARDGLTPETVQAILTEVGNKLLGKAK
jgi:hypothetical protein